MGVFALLLIGAVVMRPAVSWGQPVVIQFIKVAELRALLALPPPPVLVDVRSPEEYVARHIAGAVSIPLTEIARRASEIPRSRLVVLY